MIGVLGVNHQTADIRVRELFSFSEHTSTQLIEALKECADHFQETFVLSTCNRTEIYFRFQGICKSGSMAIIFQSIQKVLDINIEHYKQYFYLKLEDDAYRHLFTVASGLDSLAIGEYQIVNQLKDAFALAKKQKAVGKYFTRLYNKALEVSKVVRNKTGISQGATSISYVAVENCMQMFGNLKDKKILLLGLGQTGELVLKKFLKKNAQHVFIANRTLGRAIKKAEYYNGSYLPFDEAIQAVGQFDIVVASTSAGKIILSEADVKQALELTKRNTPSVFIDLSVPRNIDCNIAQLPNVTLMNIDDLEATLNTNMQERAQMVHVAEEYIEKGLDEFVQWISMQNISPLANSIKEWLHDINTEELRGFMKNKTEAERELIELYGKHIAEKYSRLFIKNLIDLTQNGKKTDYIKIANKIFE
ncbi:MAG: glutamyl-tRNA reductase [Bacteroidota bacterium]